MIKSCKKQDNDQSFTDELGNTCHIDTTWNSICDFFEDCAIFLVKKSYAKVPKYRKYLSNFNLSYRSDQVENLCTLPLWNP